jgi:hypothetical protein
MSHKPTMVAVAALLVVLPLGFALGQGADSNPLPQARRRRPATGNWTFIAATERAFGGSGRCC